MISPKPSRSEWPSRTILIRYYKRGYPYDDCTCRPQRPGAVRSLYRTLTGHTSGPRIVFNKVPEPKTVKNRLHLDVVSDTFDAETELLLSLGAERLRDVQRDKSRWTTFADIEGNEFDLIAG